MCKRFYLLTLVLALSAALPACAAQKAAWIESADTAWYENDRDASEYAIDTPEELAGLSVLVGSGDAEGAKVNFKGKTIFLDKDIDLSGRTWTSIGQSYGNFEGTFDGRGHTIEGLGTVTPFDEEGWSNGYGLFGWVSGRQAVVKNINLRGRVVASGDKCSSLGAVVGRIDQNAAVENCVFSGALKGFSGAAIGGIVGYNYGGSVRSCSVSANIATGAANPEEAKKTRVGGIAGSYECYEVGPSIENSVFTGSVRYTDGSASMRVGGIAGENSSERCIIQNCAVSADIDISGGQASYAGPQWMNCAGGAAGYNGGTINNVAVTGSVRLHADDAQNDVAAGGLAGVNVSGQNIRIENSSLSCTVSVSSPNAEKTRSGAIAGYNYVSSWSPHQDRGMIINNRWVKKKGVPTAAAGNYKDISADIREGCIISNDAVASDSKLPASAALIAPLVSLTENKSLTLTAEVHPATAYNKNEVTFLWSVKDNSIVTLSADGASAHIKGLKAGFTQASLTCGNLLGGENSYTPATRAAVYRVNIDGLKLSPETISLDAAGKSADITAEIAPDADIPSYPVLKWTYEVVSGDGAAADDIILSFGGTSLEASVTLKNHVSGAVYRITAEAVDDSSLKDSVLLTAEPAPLSGGSSGGCNSGFAAIALLLPCALALAGKTKRSRPAVKKARAGKALLVLLALLLTLLAAQAQAAEFWKADTDWYNGPAAAKGTADDPYRISDAEALAGLAALVNAGSDDFKEKYITLTADVDLAKKEWIPIGWMVAYGNLRGFAGHFDGGGHRITGMLISTGEYMPKGADGNMDPNGQRSHCTGLFGHLLPEGTIQNLYLEGSVTNKVDSGAAGLVSWTDGYVYNCIVSCDVDASGEGRSYAGVIASLIGGGLVRNCVTYGTVKSTVGAAYSGGIAGFGYWYRGNVENCVSMCSSITSTMDAGGIWGGFNSTTKYCVSTADYVEGSEPMLTGGVVGAFGFGYTECYWLKVKEGQPENGNPSMGYTDQGRITDPALLPAAAVVLDTEGFKTLKTGESREIEAKVYPPTADASALRYKWTLPEGLTLLSGSGTSKITVRADKEGFYPVSAAVTGLLGVGVESADIALTPGGILKVASKKVAVEKIMIGGSAEGIKEGESRTFTASSAPSDAEGDIKWTIAATGGEAQDSDIHLTENDDGSATVTLRRAGGTSGEYTLTATDEYSGVSASVKLTTSVIEGEEIWSILPIGDVITADVEAVKANGINSSQLDGVAKSIGASMGSFKVNEKGVVYLKDTVLQQAVMNAISDDSIALHRAISLPLFRAQLSVAGATAATAFIISGDRLLADTPRDIGLVKARPDGTGSFFAYASTTAEYKDGYFTLQRMDDGVMAAEEAIEADKSYKLVVYVKDGGDYDVDSTERSVVDPLAVVKTSKKSSGGSGGCSAGFGAFALLPVAFAALLRRRGRNGRRQ